MRAWFAAVLKADVEVSWGSYIRSIRVLNRDWTLLRIRLSIRAKGWDCKKLSSRFTRWPTSPTVDLATCPADAGL